MCMQDLLVDRRIVVRPVPGVTDGAGGRATIPASVRRVWLLVTDTSGNATVPLRVTPGGVGPILSTQRLGALGAILYHPIITIRDLPGIFSREVYADLATAQVIAYEGVLESDLGAEVVALSDALRAGRG